VNVSAPAARVHQPTGKLSLEKRIMQMESLIVGAAVVLLCGAVCFYLYIRISYMEKKVSMIESILVDVKMALDSILTEGMDAVGGGAPIPIAARGGSSSGSFEASGAAHEEPVVADDVLDEKFYSSVLESAHEEQGEAQEAPVADGSLSADEVLDNIKLAEKEDAAAAAESIPFEIKATHPMVAADATPATGPNYDAMTKAELISLAEERGLRARKNMNRNEILSLLRTTEIRDIPAGVENGSGGALFPDAAPLDGDYPVDLGQSATPA
jgi:hypothetical protein